MKDKQKHSTLFTKRQLIGAVLFLFLGACMGIAITFIQKSLQIHPEETDLTLTQQKAQELENRLRERRYESVTPHAQRLQDTVALYLQPFDPNTADSLTFRQLGLPAWIAKNVLAYRNKGGYFRTKEALRKIYGMTPERYTALEPYICIDTALLPQKTITRKTLTNKKDTLLELNACDTASLQLIRGIGPYTARQIVRYREQLGGYVTTEQLREIDALHDTADSLLQHFFVCIDSVHPLCVNHLRTERLQRHPYLSFTQAKALYELRRERFRLHSIEDLQTLNCFTETDLTRLRPYLSFEQ